MAYPLRSFMEFNTRILFRKALFTFSYEEQCILLGSCFAENIGNKLTENKFDVDINPFGILYNPASIADALKMLLYPERFEAKNLFKNEGLYHSFSHHSRFSATSEKECLEKINNRLTESSDKLKKASRLIITFGTAWVYKLKENDKVVANCHKLPESLFMRNMLTIDNIIKEWKCLLLALWERNPGIKILFTVSPVRHWKDGAHGNQLSKATLLLAIQYLQDMFPERIAYFPAYEIMLDELRDYRFYAEDMLHPSPLAVEYIWQRFSENLLSKDSQEIMQAWKEIKNAISHKPFHPESDAYKNFIHQTLLKIERIKQKMPSFDIKYETELLKSKLK